MPPPSFSATARAGLAGFFGLLAGVGLGRFGYPPLIPATIDGGWLSPEAAQAGAAAILYGYLFGAVASPLAISRFGAFRLLAAAGFLAIIAHVFSITALPTPVFIALRFCAGVSGALATVAVPPVIAALAPAGTNGTANGIAFSGFGAGFVLAGTLIPWLAGSSLEAAWGGLAVLTVAAVMGSLILALPARAAVPQALPASAPPVIGRLAGLVTLYFLVAMANVPFSVFFADHVARTLGLGLEAAGLVWVASGVAAIAGPLLSGPIVDRIGPRRALIAVTGAMSLGAVLPAVTDALALLTLANMIVVGGLMAFGAFAAGHARTIVGEARYGASWGAMTLFAAVAQASGASAFVAAKAAGIDAHAVFAAAAGIFAVALGLFLKLDRS